jgi:FxsC-like protein
MGGLREGTEAYGGSAAEWRPFYPDIEDSAADLVQQIAAGGRYFCHILPAGPELAGALDDAANNGNLVCVIVDPWAARLKQLRGMLRKIDALPHANIALLALWNEADPVTQEARLRLEEALRHALSGREEQRRGVVSVSSAQQFQAELASTLEHLRMEVIVQSTPLLVMDASVRPAIERIDLGSAWA